MMNFIEITINGEKKNFLVSDEFVKEILRRCEENDKQFSFFENSNKKEIEYNKKGINTCKVIYDTLPKTKGI
jgi:hypothetical protein